MFVDRETGVHNYKIVFFGALGSGKRSSLYAISNQSPNDRMLVRTGNFIDDGAINFDARTEIAPADPTNPYVRHFVPMKSRLRDTDIVLHLYALHAEGIDEKTAINLNGTDAFVFVADSQRGRSAKNLEAMKVLKDQISNLGLAGVPVVLQLNKRDLADAISVDEMVTELGGRHDGVIEATAHKKLGPNEALKEAFKHALKRNHG